MFPQASIPSEDPKMTMAYLVILSSFVGQFNNTQYYARGVYPGYGYFGRSPLPWYDPVRYARYYSGSGFYSYTPPPIADPEVIIPKHSVTSMPGLTGLVVGLNEANKSITLRLPVKTVSVPFGPKTKFQSSDGSFPEIKPGMLVNVDHDTITVLNRGRPY
jgi:hypothetical protein